MATRADVARLAGVSASTVTYALSGARPISEATRQRILSAMAELGYSPNLLAAGLAGGQSRLLALLFPSRVRGISNADLEYVLGAANAARELGYHLLLWPTDGQDLSEVERVSRAGLVDGVLLMEVLLDDPRVPILRQAGVPFALIGRTRQAETDCADQDFEETARTAVSHLADLGHMVIAFVNGPDRLLAAGYGATMRAGAAMRSAALDLGLDLVEAPCEHDVPAGRALLDLLVDDSRRITGVVGMNDEAIVGLMQQAQHRGLHIPRELSVVSVSASAERAQITYPPLTTVSPRGEAIGRAAVRALIGRLAEDPALTEPQLWAGELVQRGTTGPRRPVR